jgi:hypothetical protein
MQLTVYQINASFNNFGSFHEVVGRKLHGKSIHLRGQHCLGSIANFHNMKFSRQSEDLLVHFLIVKTFFDYIGKRIDEKASLLAADILVGKTIPVANLLSP